MILTSNNNVIWYFDFVVHISLLVSLLFLTLGEWKNDKMHGKGMFRFCRGGYIEGLFEESTVSGKAAFF